MDRGPPLRRSLAVIDTDGPLIDPPPPSPTYRPPSRWSRTRPTSRAGTRARSASCSSAIAAASTQITLRILADRWDAKRGEPRPASGRTPCHRGAPAPPDPGVHYYGLPDGYELETFLGVIRAIAEGRSGLDAADAVARLARADGTPLHLEVFALSDLTRLHDSRGAVDALRARKRSGHDRRDHGPAVPVSRGALRRGRCPDDGSSTDAPLLARRTGRARTSHEQYAAHTAHGAARYQVRPRRARPGLGAPRIVADAGRADVHRARRASIRPTIWVPDRIVPVPRQARAGHGVALGPQLRPAARDPAPRGPWRCAGVAPPRATPE